VTAPESPPEAPDSTESEAPARAEAASDAELLADIRSLKRGQGHTYLYLIALCVGLMAISPILNRFLETFQGVVVALPEDGPALILQQEGLLIERSVSDSFRAELSVGQYLYKVSTEWNPRPISLEELGPRADTDDPELHPRVFLPSRMKLFLESWTGTVYAIRNQKLPTTGNGMGEVGERTTLELQLDDGGRRSLVLTEELRTALLGKVAVGVRLGKRARQWEPSVLPPAAAAPPAPTAPSGPPPPAPEADSAPATPDSPATPDQPAP
jgi:hypothetical protein